MPTRRTSLGSMRSATPDDLPDTRVVQDRPRAPREVQRVLPVPGPAPRDLRPRHPYPAETQRFEKGGDAPDHRRVNPPVAHQPAATDQLRARLELGFDEQDRLP